MDIGTIIGLILASVLVIGAIVMGGGAGFFDIPSIMITIGGATGATLINFPLPKIISVMGIVRKAFLSRPQDYLALYNRLTDFATRARRDGLLALEDDIEKLDDAFTQKGFQMALDGSSADFIKRILENDIEAMNERHLVGPGIFKALANYAPAFGMIGTLIGLVQMLRNLEDPSQIGMGMAVALLTTFYGSLVANLFALPIAGKLEQRTAEEVAMKNMVMEGILAIQEGDNPAVIRQKLRSFLSPKIRQLTEREEEK